VHPAASLDEAGHYARLARNLLSVPALGTYYDEQGALRHLHLAEPVTAPARIAVFEAKTIDLGVRLLVTVAAQAAQSGMVLGQVYLLLHRLQREKLQTFVLTDDTSRLEVDGARGNPLGGIRRMLTGGETLLRIDRSTGRAEVLDQGRNLVKTLPERKELLKDTPDPCAIWIRQRGYDQQMEWLAYELRRACRPERISAKKDSLAAAPYFGSNYLELVFGPTSEEIKRVVKFVRRVWGTFGASGTLAGTI
jgi:hypothetical protein